MQKHIRVLEEDGLCIRADDGGLVIAIAVLSLCDSYVADVVQGMKGLVQKA